MSYHGYVNHMPSNLNIVSGKGYSAFVVIYLTYGSLVSGMYEIYGSIWSVFLCEYGMRDMVLQSGSGIDLQQRFVPRIGSRG